MRKLLLKRPWEEAMDRDGTDRLLSAKGRLQLRRLVRKKILTDPIRKFTLAKSC